MKPYQINDLERLTGIKAHTIRIWEKRYNLISPLRTETNRRYYTDDEVRKLLNVSTLLSYGYKISKIAALSENEIGEYIISLPQNTTDDSLIASSINSFLDLTMSFDEAGFEDLFTSLAEKTGLYELMTTIVYPFMIRVGILWSTGDTEAAQEHFATCIIRRKLMAFTDMLPRPEINSKKFLLFLPEGEWHDTGLLLANYMIRSKGYDSVYLGQSIRLESIEKVIPAIKPSFLLLFYITKRPGWEIQEQLNKICDFAKNSRILVAGNTQLFPISESGSDNIKYLKQADDLLEYLK